MRKIAVTLAVLAVFGVAATVYFTAVRPASLYYAPSITYTIVVDPGHGGTDGGAVSDGVIESGLNLSIALKLDAMLGLFGQPSVLTRDTEDIDYPDGADTLRKKKAADSKSRMKLIQNTENAVMVSIHQNKFKSGSVSGAQIFYSKHPGSKELAVITQRYFNQVLEPDNPRQAKQIPDEIFLMKNTGCPAILAECGFISNPRERELLQTDGYQTKIAAALLAAVMTINN